NTSTQEEAVTSDLLNLPKQVSDPIAFAQITIFLSEGEGCGCTPIRYAPITAYGLTTDHNTSGITDEEGICVLELEFDQTYRVLIDIEGYHRVLFDFEVIDDQSFTFHMKVAKGTPVFFNGLSQILQRIENIKASFRLLN
ncbi:MAG: hypothetical protein KKC68_04005, partial [Candidatus Thermoplasmatota archaeon]|nr:hypothetical protein [Candidatus Thermoplasmatota archaeon]